MRHRPDKRLSMRSAERLSWRGLRALAIAGSAVWLSACASTPLPTDDLELSSQTPADVVAEASASAADASSLRKAETTSDVVLWGGVVIASTPLSEGSQLEILGYPLDRTQRPRLDAGSQGRFLVLSDEFLEPLDYAPGRSVTILGRLEGVTPGVVGEVRHPFATIRMNEIHLWQAGAQSEKPRLTFGIGINLSN